jgi:hypothetical protein
MSTQPHRQHDPWEIPKLLAAVAIDYLRWTQLIPMVFAWFIAIGVVLVFIALAFQSDINDYIERNEARIEQVVERWWGPVDGQANEGSEDIGAKIDADAIKSFIYKAWAVLAFVAYMLALLRNAVFGKPEPIGLRRKLKVVGVAALTCGGLAFMLALVMGPASDQGIPVLIFGLFLYTIALWLVSAYSLSVNHLLLKLRDWLFDETSLAS